MEHLVGELELKVLVQRSQICLVFSRVVVQSLIPTFTVDVGKLVNYAQGGSLWNLHIKLYHNRGVTKLYGVEWDRG
jgi:hypothetical protein